MHRTLAIMALGLFISLGLTACSKPKTVDDYVVGPDLESPTGPFGSSQLVVLSEPEAVDTAKTVSDGFATHKGPALMRVEIRKDGPLPVATLLHVLPGTKSYLAGVTWHSFTPIVAETNKEARQYWIGGFNLSRTPDRSIYMLLRYPKDVRFSPGVRTDQAQYLLLSCYDIEVGRMPVESFAPVDSKATTKPEFKPDPAPEAGNCEFNSLKEAYLLTPQILNHYDRIKHYKDAPNPLWLPVTIESQ